MLDITLIAVGKMKEKFYISAAEEYIKRLGAYCRIGVTELSEARRSREPSEKEISAALDREAEDIFAAVPKGAQIIALCVEGRELTSPEFSSEIEKMAAGGVSKLCIENRCICRYSECSE